MLALDKAFMEATPAEIAIVLGWLINTRKIWMSLPDDKYVTGTADIQAILDKANANNPISWQSITQLLGRLNHTTFVLQEGRHFLNQIRAAEMRAASKRKSRGSARRRATTSNFGRNFWRKNTAGSILIFSCCEYPTTLSEPTHASTVSGGFLSP